MHDPQTGETSLGLTCDSADHVAEEFLSGYIEPWVTLNTQNTLKYLGLIDGIWASLGLEFAYFSLCYFILLRFKPYIFNLILCQSCDGSNPSPGLAKCLKPTQIGNLALVMSSTELILTDRLLMKCGPDIYCQLLSQICNLSI